MITPDTVAVVGLVNDSRSNGGASGRRCLIWLNLLGLDASLVAVAWQWLFARTLHTGAGGTNAAALFLTTWLIYLADRLADSAALKSNSQKSARQAFCSQHRSTLRLLLIVIAALDFAICSQLEYATLLHGIFLGTLVAGYLVINHARSEIWETIPGKEIIIGILFAAGTVCVFPSHVLAEPTTALAILLFAGLCSANCTSIAVWEAELDRSQNKHSIGTRGRGAASWAHLLPILLALGAIALSLFEQSLLFFAVCLAGSALSLTAIHFALLTRDERCALADLVLLAPLAFFFAEKIL